MVAIRGWTEPVWLVRPVWQTEMVQVQVQVQSSRVLQQLQHPVDGSPRPPYPCGPA